MARRAGLILMLAGAFVALGTVMYVVGFQAGAAAHQAVAGTGPVAAEPVQSPPPLQEFIPLPGRPEDQQGTGNQQQGQDCEPVILFYYQGRLYQLRPGPGQGPQNGPGRPGTPPEYFPLTPYQGPAIPGLPGIPFGPQPGPGTPTPIPGSPPNFQPQNPRF